MISVTIMLAFSRMNYQWDDYFSNANSYIKVKSPNQLFSKTIDLNFYITQSTFSKLHNRAIYISYKDGPLILVESASIIDCSSSDNNKGGSIFFDGNSFILSKCCLLKSNMFGTNKDGTAAYTECKNSSQSKNNILLSNVFQNADQTDNSGSTLILQKGSILFNYLNFTGNKCISSGLITMIGNDSAWINNTNIIENNDEGIAGVLENVGFYEFLLKDNVCAADDGDKLMFSLPSPEFYLLNYVVMDETHANVIVSTGNVYFGDGYICAGIAANGIIFVGTAKFACPDPTPTVELPVENKCAFYVNKKADNTFDDRSGKHHVGLVALLGYSSMS